MTDLEILLKASNIAVALKDYFRTPTISETDALSVILRKLQSDKDTAERNIYRNRVASEK